MKLSIVIPAHNEESYIKRTLDAVLAQNYPDFEVIVVDNASTDKTAEIARQFPNVKVVTEERKGILFARECGRRAATGDIIVNIDADCQPESDWLKKGVAYFSTKNVVSVTGPYYYFDGGSLFKFISINIQKIIYYPFNLFLQAFHIGAVLIGGNNFIRADVLKKIGGYNTSILFYGEDTDTAKRLAPEGKMIFSNDLVMKTSARRFIREGMVVTSFLYIINFVWITFFKMPYNKIKVGYKNLSYKK